MTDSRHTSPRPDILVDQGSAFAPDLLPGAIGRAATIGRDRVVAALPLGDGPRLLVEPTVIVDAHGGYVVDAAGGWLGRSPVWVSRMLSARFVDDTRRIG